MIDDIKPATWRNYKPVNFHIDDHQQIKEWAEALAQERNNKASMPSYLLEAAAYFEKHRKEIK